MLHLISEEARKWWTLAAVAFGLFMIMLDNTVVNVALPAIQDDLGVGLSELEWIVTGYALTFAALMLTGGKLADLLGRRMIFVVGLLTEHGHWSWIFYINIPVGILAIAASFLFIDESKDTSEVQRLDLPGLLTSGIGLFSLTYGLIEANLYGWTSGRIVGAFVVATVMLIAFVLLETHQRLPMLDLSLFRNGTFAGANLAVLLVALAMFGVFFFVSLYMQGILG